MKFFAYILTILLLVVNMQYTHVYATLPVMEASVVECSTTCCTSEKKAQESEKPACCADSFCSISMNSAFAINYSYSPEVPQNKTKKEFLPGIYTYTNLYTLSHINDFWNPPKA